MIINVTHLDEQQFKAFEGLRDACLKHDGGLPAVYPLLITHPRTLPTHCLLYQKGELVGFAAIYFFFDNACELTLLVHPNWRGHGYSQQLVMQLIPLLKHHNMSEVIFSSPESFQKKWQQRPELRYHHSEYKMRREDKAKPDYHPKLTYRLAHEGDLNRLDTIDKLCFPESTDNSKKRLIGLMNTPNYDIYVGEIKQSLYKKIICKAHIHWTQNAAILSDIAVLPKYQGKGIGKELISHCLTITHQQQQPVVELDVEVTNKGALNLYIQFGFKMTNACDFWSWKI